MYSLNYIIFKTALSCPSRKILKFTVIFYPLILTYTSFVFKLIMSSLYSTSLPKIIINGYRYSFSLYSIPNYSIISGIMWFLVTLLSTITLNCLSRYLTLKLKYLLIVLLRVSGLFTSSLKSYRPNLFSTINHLTNI